LSAPEGSGRLAYLRNVLHPTIAVSVPLLFLVLATELARSVLRIPLSPFAYLFLLMAGIEEVVAGNILFEERVGSFERVREPFYLLAAVGLVLLLFERGPLAGRPRGLLRPEIIYLGLLVLLEWLLCWRIHQGLRERELLEASFEGKEGPALQGAIRDNAELARIAIAAVPRVKGTVFLFQVAAFAAVISLFAAGVRISSAATVLFVVHALAGVAAAALLNNAAEDQLLSAEGVSLSPFYRRRRQIYVIAIFCASVALVLLYARRTSLLPLAVFQPLLDWLARLLNRKRELPPLRYPVGGMTRPDMNLLRQLQGEAAGPSPLALLIGFLLRVVWNIVKLGLFMLLAYFLIAPLASRVFRRRLRRLRPLHFVGEQLSRFARALRRMLDDVLGWLRRAPGSRERAGRRGRNGRSWRGRLRLRGRGLFKLWEMGTVLRAYARLIRWGERQGVRFRLPIAPREYLALLAQRRPEQEPSLAEAGEILEESLYSPLRARRERLQRYLRIVKDVVRAKS
jgi:hypothetical protein